jgi:hypothetical protein
MAVRCRSANAGAHMNAQPQPQKETTPAVTTPATILHPCCEAEKTQQQGKQERRRKVTKQHAGIWATPINQSLVVRRLAYAPNP